MNEEVNFAMIESINARLDELSHRHFHSVSAIDSAVQEILSEYDIDFPGGIDAEEDTIFNIEGEDDLFLYVVVDQEPVGYSVYAQLLEQEDIIDIQDGIDGMGSYENIGVDFLTRVRHSADD
jgi:hypothetical protein